MLHNLDDPLISRLREGRPTQIQRAIVVSPWHSSSASPRKALSRAVLKAVGRALGARPVVYTEGENGKGPALGKESRVRILEAGRA